MISHDHLYFLYLNRVDLVLSKSEEAMWPLVVEGDTRGEMVINPEEAAAIHEQLARLTSEELVCHYFIIMSIF